MQMKSVVEPYSYFPPPEYFSVINCQIPLTQMLDKVTWQLDIYNAVGERSASNNK